MPCVRSASAASDPSPLYDTVGVVGKGGEGVAGVDCEENDTAGVVSPPLPGANARVFVNPLGFRCVAALDFGLSGGHWTGSPPRV